MFFFLDRYVIMNTENEAMLFSIACMYSLKRCEVSRFTTYPGVIINTENEAMFFSIACMYSLKRCEVSRFTTYPNILIIKESKTRRSRPWSLK